MNPFEHLTRGKDYITMVDSCRLQTRSGNTRLIIPDSEQPKLLEPITGYSQEPLLSLSEACAPLDGIVQDIFMYVSTALEHTSAEPSDGLTRDESAAIRLYTMDWTEANTSLYFILNNTLKMADRHLLQPWFKYLKLLLTALVKIPCAPPQTVWRGIRKNIIDKYPHESQVIWWSFSSCTKTLTVLESELFLGKIGERTLFSIEVYNGRNIQAHSHFDAEDEILMLPGSCMEVQSRLNPASDLHIIHLKQIKPEETLLEPPFEGARLCPKISKEIFVTFSKRQWYHKKRFIILSSLLVAMSLIAVILGVVLTQNTSIAETEIVPPPCPINVSNVCTYSTHYTMVAEGYYGTELVYMNCSHALSNITAVITVQKTVNATYAKQYNTFLEGAVRQDHEETSSQIFYRWFTNSGQTIVDDLSYYVEAQFQLQGINQTVMYDTYSITAQVACSGQVLTQMDHF